MPATAVSYDNPELAEAERAIKRRQAITDLLTRQSMQPIQGAVVGGAPTPVSPLQGVAKIAEALLAGYEDSRNEAKLKEIATERSEKLGKVVRAMQPWKNPDTDTTARDQAVIDRPPPLGARYMAPGETAQGTGGLAGGAAAAAAQGFPGLGVQFALAQVQADEKAKEAALQRDILRENKQAELALRRDIAEMRSHDMRLSDKERAAAAERLNEIRLEMARIAAGSRPPVPVVDPKTGQTVWMPPQEALGKPAAVSPNVVAQQAGAGERADSANETQRQNKLAELALRRDIAELQSHDRRLSDKERAAAAERLNEIRLEMARIAAGSRPPVPVVDPKTGQTVWMPPQEALGKPVAVHPNVVAQQAGATERAETRAAAPKPIPVPLQRQLTESAELVLATQRFSETFKPEYAGSVVGGEVRNWIGRRLGDDTGRTAWWQNYDLHASQVRNKLFGSALTATELAAWEKSAINPNMDPKLVQQNLAERARIEQAGLQRLMAGARKSGYRPDEIEAFTGIPMSGAAPAPGTPQSGAALPLTNAQGWRLAEDAQGRQAYVNPDNPQEFEVVGER